MAAIRHKRVFAQDLGKRFPLDTQMQSLWLPAIQAQLALDRKNPDLGPECPATCRTHRVSVNAVGTHISCLYRLCTRRAYLATGQGNAATEFQKILDQADRLETADGSVSASAVACQCCAVREPRSERMPMLPASGAVPASRIS